jgi:hypothetical protein
VAAWLCGHYLRMREAIFSCELRHACSDLRPRLAAVSRDFASLNVRVPGNLQPTTRNAAAFPTTTHSCYLSGQFVRPTAALIRANSRFQA